jgi:hypothetical protein
MDDVMAMICVYCCVYKFSTEFTSIAERRKNFILDVTFKCTKKERRRSSSSTNKRRIQSFTYVLKKKYVAVEEEH